MDPATGGSSLLDWLILLAKVLNEPSCKAYRYMEWLIIVAKVLNVPFNEAYRNMEWRSLLAKALNLPFNEACRCMDWLILLAEVVDLPFNWPHLPFRGLWLVSPHYAQHVLDWLIFLAKGLDVPFRMCNAMVLVFVAAKSGIVVWEALEQLWVVHIMRVIRILRCIGELRAIVSSMVGSARALIWTLAVLVLVICIFAVYITQSVSDYRVEPDGDGSGANGARLELHSGSPMRTMLLLYLASAGGVAWYSLAQLFMVSIFVTLGLRLSAYVALTVVALLGMITSLMDEAAPVYAREDKYSWATEAAACGAAPVP